MKNLKQNLKTTWRGIQRLFNTVTDLATGLSALGVMALATAYAHEHRSNRWLLSAAAFAIGIMGWVAAVALGRYLNRLGREQEQ